MTFTNSNRELTDPLTEGPARTHLHRIFGRPSPAAHGRNAPHLKCPRNGALGCPTERHLLGNIGHPARSHREGAVAVRLESLLRRAAGLWPKAYH